MSFVQSWRQARQTWREEAFRVPFLQGARDMSEVAPGIAAWGLVTGVAMIDAGLGWPLSLFMTFIVFAGSAQLTAIPLIASGAPIWVTWLAAACVNLRFVIFSAQWRPYWAHLPLRQRLKLAYFTADLTYVLFMRRYPEPKPAPGQQAYLWGTVAVNWGSWQGATLLGMLLSNRIPPEWNLGFAGTVALLGVTCSLLADRATWVTAAVAGCAAVAAYALPLKLNIVVAIAAAVAIGVLLDHRRPGVAQPVDDKT